MWVQLNLSEVGDSFSNPVIVGAYGISAQACGAGGPPGLASLKPGLGLGMSLGLGVSEGLGVAVGQGYSSLSFSNSQVSTSSQGLIVGDGVGLAVGLGVGLC